MTERMDPKRTEFQLNQKKVLVYPGTPGSPVVYLNCSADEVREKVHGLLAADPSCPPHSLVLISGIDWTREMSPWYCGPVFRRGPAYEGAAEEYLSWMTSDLFPTAEALLQNPGGRVIAGYSLAGLFALWSLYRTDAFRAAASMSGSLWYPGIIRFVKEQRMKRKPDCVYFSLGSAEASARNRILRTVRKNTEAIEQHLSDAGIRTAFVLNPGNHFVQSAERTAAGILWILRSEHQDADLP